MTQLNRAHESKGHSKVMATLEGTVVHCLVTKLNGRLANWCGKLGDSLSSNEHFMLF